MKSNIPAINSYRKIISEKNSTQLGKGSEAGRIVVPVNESDAQTILPSVKDTSTYSVLKTDKMNGELKLTNGSIKGCFKGLVLDNAGGSLSISKIELGIQQVIIGSDAPEGSRVDFISDGDDWFMWGLMNGGADQPISERATARVDLPEGHPKDKNNNEVPDELEEEILKTGIDPEALTNEELNQRAKDAEAGEDTSPPPKPILDETGITEGAIINSPTPTFKGRTEAGSNVSITITIDGVEQTVVADENGNWSFTAPTLTEGIKEATIIATDPSGNVSDPTIITFTVDTTPPVISVERISSPGVSIAGTTITVAEGGTYDYIAFTDDGTIVVETGDLDFDVAGTYTQYFNATDDAGNVAQQQTLTFVVEEVLAIPSITSFTDSSANEVEDGVNAADPFNISGTAHPNSTLELYLDGTLEASIPVDSNGDWSYQLTVADGTYEVSYRTRYSDNSFSDTYVHFNSLTSIPLRGTVIDDDLFNSTEITTVGANPPTVSPGSNQIYWFNSGLLQGFQWNNGAKYDPVDLAAYGGQNYLEYYGARRTFSIWVKTTNINATQAFLAKSGKTADALNARGGWWFVLENNKFYFLHDADFSAADDANKSIYYDGSADGDTLSSNTWYHVVYSFGGTDSTLWVNGTARTLTNAAGGAVNFTTRLDPATKYAQEGALSVIDGNGTHSTSEGVLLTAGFNRWTENRLDSFLNGKIAFPEFHFGDLTPSEISSKYTSQLNTITTLGE